MKKLFPKKKQPSISTGKADLKQSINQIRMGIKKYEKDSQDFHLRARKAVAEGNINLAKNYLLRRKRALGNLERFQGFIIKLERQQDAIDSAETIKTMGTTMKSTTAVLKKHVDELNPEQIMEMNEESEEAIANLEESAEVMSENPDSEAESDAIDEELEELKTQVMLDGGNLPETPTSNISVPLEDDTEPIEEDPSKSEKVKKELEKLKKELDG
nr:Snf7 family protein [Candidatus Sigynarchaeota archaeon]